MDGTEVDLPLLDRMILEFSDHYQPVDTVEDFTSTEDLYAAFQSFYPGTYSRQYLAEQLGNIFAFRWVPELQQFCWLIGSKY